MFSKRIILILGLFCFSIALNAQVLQKTKSPTKASIYSALLPGAGQVYNGKYWKAPLVYASLGNALYIAYWHKKEYLHYREAFEFRTDGNEETTDAYVDIYTESNLVTIKNYHQKYRDLGYIITAGVYLLNIIDASVDAHLFNFNVNENLALEVKPTVSSFQNNNVFALSLCINLKK